MQKKKENKTVTRGQKKKVFTEYPINPSCLTQKHYYLYTLLVNLLAISLTNCQTTAQKDMLTQLNPDEILS